MPPWSATPSTTSASVRAPRRATPRSCGRGRTATSPASRSSRSSGEVMATTVRDAGRPAVSPRRLPAGDASPSRRPFRDNPRLILLGIAVLLAALVAMVTLADRSAELNPDFLTEVVLYALSAADLTMLLA